MEKKRFLLTDYQKILIFGIPLLYFVIGSYFRNLLGNFSLRCFDPEYIYFMSGLTMSEGVLKVGHIDNPGTPLQVLVAVIFRLVYFIRSTPTPYLDDVFTHPDLYLAVVNLTITFLTSLLLIYAGNMIFRYTRNILMAVLFQTAPFLPLIWYDIIGRIVPELMMVFPVVLMSVLIIKISYRKEKPVSLTEVILFSMLAAFGLSVKLSFLPIWIIPLFLLPTWKNRLVFAGTGILFFFLFAFPVTLKLEIFWTWVKNLFLHSGAYGSGEANIVDFSLFKSNVREMIGLEKRFFILLIVLTVSLIIYFIIFRKKSSRFLLFTSLGVILTAILQLLMVGKHFAHRYYIPILMFTPLLIFLGAQIIQTSYNKKITLLFINLLIIAYMAWSYSYNRICFQQKTEAMEMDVANRSMTWHFAETLEKDSYKIITSQNYGCPFIEYTLFYSHVWANYDKHVEYKGVLGRLYPRAYSYFTFSDEMKYWNQKLSVDTIRASGKNTYLYIENDDSTLFKKSLMKIHAEDTTNFSIESKLLYRNPLTTEVIYKLDFNAIKNEDNQLSL